MKLTQKLRQLWHDIYYVRPSEKGILFAMKCKDVTAKIDLHEGPSQRLGRFRFWLHISLCQACKNYLTLSRVLRNAIREQAQQAPSPVDLNRFNKELLVKYLKK